MTVSTRATDVDRLFGRQADPAPQAPADDPAVLEAATVLGIPAREVQAVHDHPDGLVADTNGVAYLITAPDVVDALGQHGGGPDGRVFVFDPSGSAPRLGLPRWTTSKELSSGPWGGADFSDVAREALGIAVQLGELRSGEQVQKWVDGDPVKAAAFWAASARSADLPAAQAARANPMAAWARQLIIRSGVVNTP
ncbi:MAG TPA: hypothetical protein VGM21_04035 [Actinomycetota bacterium]